MLAIFKRLASGAFVPTEEDSDLLAEYVAENFLPDAHSTPIFAEIAHTIALNEYEFGHETEESATRYWLRILPLSQLARLVSTMDCPPEKFAVDVEYKAGRSARTCAGACKAKFEPGELRVTATTVNYTPAMFKNGPYTLKTEAFCLDARCIACCVAKHGLKIVDLVGECECVGKDARVIANARLTELATHPTPTAAKPTARFLADRKLSKTAALGETYIALNKNSNAMRALEKAAEGEEERKRREVAEAKERALEFERERKMRYAPLIEVYRNAPIPSDDRCVFVFSKGPQGEPGPFPCPYDHGNGSPFCSMCAKMVREA
jgi:hypothetical protein